MVSSSIAWLVGSRMKFELEKLRGVHLRPRRGKDWRKDVNISETRTSRFLGRVVCAFPGHCIYIWMKVYGREYQQWVYEWQKMASSMIPDGDWQVRWSTTLHLWMRDLGLPTRANLIKCYNSCMSLSCASVSFSAIFTDLLVRHPAWSGSSPQSTRNSPRSPYIFAISLRAREWFLNSILFYTGKREALRSIQEQNTKNLRAELGALLSSATCLGDGLQRGPCWNTATSPASVYSKSWRPSQYPGNSTKTQTPCYPCVALFPHILCYGDGVSLYTGSALWTENLWHTIIGTQQRIKCISLPEGLSKKIEHSDGRVVP